jgi:hypothetical protein
VISCEVISADGVIRCNVLFLKDVERLIMHCSVHYLSIDQTAKSM